MDVKTRANYEGKALKDRTTKDVIELHHLSHLEHQRKPFCLFDLIFFATYQLSMVISGRNILYCKNNSYFRVNNVLTFENNREFPKYKC